MEVVPMMKTGLCLMLLVAVLPLSARGVGKPRREYRGKIYIYQPYYYQGPVWYAGNGYIARRPTGYVNYNAPVWHYRSY